MDPKPPRPRKWLIALPLAAVALVVLALIVVFASDVPPPLPEDEFGPAFRQGNGYSYQLQMNVKLAEAVVKNRFPEAKPVQTPASTPGWITKIWRTSEWQIELRGVAGSEAGTCSLDLLRVPASESSP